MCSHWEIDRHMTHETNAPPAPLWPFFYRVTNIKISNSATRILTSDRGRYRARKSLPQECSSPSSGGRPESWSSSCCGTLLIQPRPRLRARSVNAGPQAHSGRERTILSDSIPEKRVEAAGNAKWHIGRSYQISSPASFAWYKQSIRASLHGSGRDPERGL